MENRRSDKRMLPPDLQVRVKQTGRKDNVSFVDCNHIDISINGLAFYTNELKLELLQKIELQIFVGRRLFEGSAVVCHIDSSGDQVRYGVLFIDLKPTLEEVFGIKSMFSDQIKEVAVSMADNAIFSQTLDDNERNLKKAQLFLFDGVKAFKNRITERILDISDTSLTARTIDDLFEFQIDRSAVTVPILGIDGTSVVRCMISPQMDSISRHIVFVADNGRTFTTLIEFLQELSDTFALLLAGD